MAKHDFNLAKSYLLPLLIYERGVEPIVIINANQFASFMFGDVQLLDKLNFLAGLLSPDSFLKTYKTLETENLFPYERFDDP